MSKKVVTKMRRLSLLLFLLTIIFVGCSNQEQTNNDKKVENKETENKESEEEQNSTVSTTPSDDEEEQNDKEQEITYKYTYPLTGIGTDEEFNNRVIAVMINNLNKARPQTGVHLADVVYEVLAEGSITRFLALYQSEIPEIVGPVRSARQYFIDLTKGYDGIYVYHGAAWVLEDKLKKGIINNLNGAYYDNDQFLFKRVDFRSAPHDSYLIFDNVYKAAEKRGYSVTNDVQPLAFLSKEEVGKITGIKSDEVRIVYHKDLGKTVTFLYNSNTAKYQRFSDGKKSFDLETKTPIEVSNIFIVETAHKVIDNVGRRDIDLISGGKGYLIQKGYIQEVEWQNVNGQILPFKNNQPLGFVPGKTWINIIPESPGLNEAVIINEKKE